MGSISDYLENALLNHIFGVSAYTRPTTVYLGLSTADPTDTGAGIAEPVAGNYARETCAMDPAASRAIDNTGLITFNQASGAWGTITHWFLCDHLANTNWGTGVNMLAHGALATSKGVVAGNTPSVAAGEVKISFNAGAISNYLANALLDFVFRNQAYAQPTIYVALATSNLTDATTGSNIVEPATSGDNYDRVEAPYWVEVSSGETENEQVITFPVPASSWGTITAAALLDAAMDGNVLFYDNSITEQTPDNGDTVEFPAGNFTVSMS